MQYLFSALDMAFFTLLYESDLPEVVADPLGKVSEKKLAKLQSEFFSRWQKVDLLKMEGDTVILDNRLAKCLAPIYDGDIAVKHLHTAWVRQTDYDKIFYISKRHGVVLLKNVRGMYELHYYKDLCACHDAFLNEFDLSATNEFSGVVFKICENAVLIESLFENHEQKQKKMLEDFSSEHHISVDYLNKILTSVLKDKQNNIVEVARKENVKLGGIMVKLVPENQYMMRFIASPDGNLISLESYSSSDILHKIINFEGR